MTTCTTYINKTINGLKTLVPKFENTIHQFSGGEKRKILLALGLSSEAELILWDEPTNHLDLESITAFNNSLKKFPGTIMLTSHDHEFTQTIANRIIELTPNGTIDRYLSFDDYMSDNSIKEQRAKMYKS